MKTLLTTSWDDGHPQDLRLAELLAKYGLTGTFYIPRASQRPTLTADQVRHLSQRFEIGGHTLDHIYLDTVPDQQAHQQIAGCAQWLSDLLGRQCKMFCPPGGQFTRRHLPMIAGAGFGGLRTVELLSLRAPRRAGGLAILPTTIQAYAHARSAYVRNALKRRSMIGLWRAACCGDDWTAVARKLLDRALAAGGVFHLWGHSWEIEQYQQWPQLEEILRLMAGVASAAPCVANSEL
jgi:peptidoglycan/xylan/chitin deacetylase (PgdA/CDA1 family)